MSSKFAYTGSVDADAQVSAEEEVAALLYERTELDEDDCQDLSRQIAILVAKHMAPNLVVEVLE
jgi:hypothetical protein